MSGEAEDPRAARERALVRVLELTEELVALKLELGARMKQGCFDLAAARYSRPVSRTQYDMNMRATTRVVTRVSDDAPAGGTTCAWAWAMGCGQTGLLGAMCCRTSGFGGGEAVALE